MFNPFQLLKLFMGGGGTPEQFLSRALGTNITPMFKNLMSMAKNNDSKGVETFARNYMKEQGRDFDKEFNEFMQQVKPK